tara:strand:- start:88 stop:1101 length:1014 start_codon:yes stop_codon:yes gene_type:complete
MVKKNNKKIKMKKNVLFFILILLFLFVLYKISNKNYEGHSNNIEHEHSDEPCNDDDDCNGNGICENEECICNAGYDFSNNCADVKRPDWWSRTHWERIPQQDKSRINTVINRYRKGGGGSILVEENSDSNIRYSLCPTDSYADDHCLNGIHRFTSTGMNGLDREDVRDLSDDLSQEERSREVQRIRRHNNISQDEKNEFHRRIFTGNYPECPSWTCIDKDQLSAWRVMAMFYIASIRGLENESDNCPSIRAIQGANSTLRRKIRGYRPENAKNWVYYKNMIFDDLDDELIDIYNNYIHNHPGSHGRLPSSFDEKLQSILDIYDAELVDSRNTFDVCS